LPLKIKTPRGVYKVPESKHRCTGSNTWTSVKCESIVYIWVYLYMDKFRSCGTRLEVRGERISEANGVGNCTSPTYLSRQTYDN
jgi:hypothetical protein